MADSEETLPTSEQPGDETASGTQTPTAAPLFVSFEWEHAARQCELDGDCRASFQVVGAGTMVDSEPGNVRSVRARAADFEAFAQLATDESVRTALLAGAGCTRAAADSDDRVVLRVGSEAPIAGHLNGCTGEPYEKIRAAVHALRAEYFPH